MFHFIFSLTDSTNLSLNSSSACSQLRIKHKTVSRKDVEQDYDRQLRYSGYQRYSNMTYQVLCKESLSGRCYFEVKLNGEGCSIAFSYDTINQGGDNFIFGSNDRSWKCDFSAANICVRHSSQNSNISVVSKIGVFLDQEAGTLSFYNISDKMTLLHRIQATFTLPLYPGFSFANWKNTTSVSICDLL